MGYGRRCMYSIGVDIGGMSIKVGIVDKNGTIVKRDDIVTDVNGGADKIIADIAQSICGLVDIRDSEFAGIGVGCPGAVNTQTGVVNRAYNLEWTDVELAAGLKKHIGKPVRISNDANAAALGETMFGIGKSYTNTVMITLGTGVGGGAVLDGKLYEGNEGKGGELGHMVLVVDGEQCTCGRRGCMEAYCSATALVRETKKAMLADKKSEMWKFSPTLDDVSGRTAFECCKKGDKAARAVVEYYIKYLGEGMLNYANIFRPQAIIIGGGVCAQGDYLINKLVEYCRSRDYGFAGMPPFDILVATLGNGAGIIGAASLILPTRA